jgi:hypothetical protein
MMTENSQSGLIACCAAIRIVRHSISADCRAVRIASPFASETTIDRALGTLTADTITWVWIGTRAEYDRLVNS